MDFKWEMQERIDQGMSPEQAYEATRDSYAAVWDNRDKYSSGRLTDAGYENPRAYDRPGSAFHCSSEDVDESAGLSEHLADNRAMEQWQEEKHARRERER